MKTLERVRWRCRRGMLELDILLARFVEQHYAALEEAEQAAFCELLEMPDAELWDRITGNLSSPHEAERRVIERLRMTE